MEEPGFGMNGSSRPERYHGVIGNRCEWGYRRLLRLRLWHSQRVLADRAIRGYHTVSTEVECALAGTPTGDLEVEVLAKVDRQAAQFRAEKRYASGLKPFVEPRWPTVCLSWRLFALALSPWR